MSISSPKVGSIVGSMVSIVNIVKSVGSRIKLYRNTLFTSSIVIILIKDKEIVPNLVIKKVSI